MNEASPFGVLVEFDTPEQLLAAAKAARDKGLDQLDAFTPFAVEGLADALGQHDRRIAWIGLIGGLAGAGGGYAMQVAANLDYPIGIGGRPLLPPQTFALITFELLVLGAVLAMVLGLFVLCRLPRLNHPLFDVERFERATVDGFFLFVPLRGTANDRRAAQDLLLARDPRSIVEVQG